MRDYGEKSEYIHIPNKTILIFKSTPQGRLGSGSSPSQKTPRDAPSSRIDSRPDTVEPPNRVSSPQGGSYSSYKKAEERASFIKQQAEQRMAERLAALGLKPPVKPEAKERQDRVRQAEEEDAKRENERQRRLADESPSAPDISKTNKKPPPPPTRKNRADSAAQRAESKRKTDEEATLARAEQEGKEQAIKEQQQAQASETRQME